MKYHLELDPISDKPGAQELLMNRPQVMLLMIACSWHTYGWSLVWKGVQEQAMMPCSGSSVWGLGSPS